MPVGGDLPPPQRATVPPNDMVRAVRPTLRIANSCLPELSGVDVIHNVEGTTMIVSVHIDDLALSQSLRMLTRPPKANATPGLRHLNVGIAAPLSSAIATRPQFGRVAVIGFWDDAASLDSFLARDIRMKALNNGCSGRFEPLRAHGSWPGLDVDVPKARNVAGDGAVAVLTLGRLRVSQAPRFLATSAKAEGAVLTAPGLLWATGLAKPPFVATCSFWESAESARAYAYGTPDQNSTAPHPHAVSEGNKKPFHHQEAFIRFHPLEAKGSLNGRNALAAEVVSKL